MISSHLNSNNPHMIEMILQNSRESGFFFPSLQAWFPHPLFIYFYFLLSKEMPCKILLFFSHEKHMVSSSCREECVLVARTLRFSPSQPSTHARGLWHGLFLWTKTNTNQTDKLWITHSCSCCACFTPKRQGLQLPLFSLSIALLLPAYVGLISFPSSSMMASSSAYLFWGTWLPVEPWR